MHYITAGESHGSSLMTIVYDVPAGLSVPQELINADLVRRQSGYGRSSRQENHDTAFIASGLADGRKGVQQDKECLNVAGRHLIHWKA